MIDAVLRRTAGVIGRIRGAIGRRLDHGTTLSGDLRSTRQERLAVILAGYKSALWDLTLTRFPRGGDGIDICLVGAGRVEPRLVEIAKAKGWSYLHTPKRWPAPALNAAIARHPEARWIHKLDEDMILPAGYFDRMAAGYRRIDATGLVQLGFLAPLINVNGYGYVHVLRQLGADAAYRERFGELRHAAGGIHAHYDGEAARFIWRQCLPFDAVAARFASAPWTWSMVPHRFSIGAVLLERGFWEDIGGFHRPFAGPLLGPDEEHLCRNCVERSRVMAVDHSILAGHFSFGPQEAAMLAILPEIRAGLAVA